VTRTRIDLALAAAFATVCFWASAFVGIRDAGHHISPGALSLGRLVVASLALGALVLARGEAMPRRSDLPRLVLFALLWLGAYQRPAERGRAPRRRGHGSDARQRRADPDRRARRAAACRGVPAQPVHGLRRGPRRRGVDRDRDLRTWPRLGRGRGALPGPRGRVRLRRHR